VVIVVGLVALGAGNFPCCKPDEGNRVFFRPAWSHVLTKNYSVIAFRVFALDAIISLYQHVAHLAALDASRISFLRCNQVDRQANFRVADGFSEIRTLDWKVGSSAHPPDVPLQINDYIWVATTVRECVRFGWPAMSLHHQVKQVLHAGTVGRARADRVDRYSSRSKIPWIVRQ
jgi:hypothetical protein